MNLKTYSLFYYGIEITELNRYIDFSDGDGTWSAKLNLGGYTLTQLSREIRRAMNSSGTTKRYLVTVDRLNRFYTIKTQDLSNFSLLFSSGSNSALSSYDIIGFDKVDYTGSNQYSSLNPVGKTYHPQFLLQNYLDYRLNKTPINASVNISASGKYVEIIGYNSSRIFRFDLRYITNEFTGDSVIRYRPNGVNETIDFLNYCTNGNPIEFMPDENDVNEYIEAMLFSTSTSGDGVGFELLPDYDANLPEFYKITSLTFREI